MNTAIAANGLVADTTVHLRSVEDAARMRRDLVRALWGDSGYPFGLVPTTVEVDVASPIAHHKAAQRIDRLVIVQEAGFATNAYVFRPSQPNGRVVLWQQGHSHDLASSNGAQAVEQLVADGFTVIALWMPLFGESTAPVLSHDAMMTIAVRSGSPMKLFLEPAIAAINWAVSTNEFDEVAMMGISGGGWTTTLVAALDKRVTRSVPIAGSVPLYMRETRDRGDAEQNLSSLYRIAGYLDLYALGSLEANRKQLQVLNRSDNCCFSAGVRASSYEPLVSAGLGGLEHTGTWRLFVDDSQDDHRVSSVALQVEILPFLKEQAQ